MHPHDFRQVVCCRHHRGVVENDLALIFAHRLMTHKSMREHKICKFAGSIHSTFHIACRFMAAGVRAHQLN